MVKAIVKEPGTSLQLPEEKKAPALVTVPGTAQIMIYKPAEIEVYDDVDEHEGAVGEDALRRLSIWRILQANSPQCKRGLPASIPGCKEGDFFNTATMQFYDGERGLFFVGVNKHMKYVEYIKREEDGSGGGFLGVYEAGHKMVVEAIQRRIEKYGNLFGKIENGVVEEDGPTKGKEKQLVESHYIDGVLIVPNEDGSFPGEFGTVLQGSIAFQSSFIKAYNAWDERVGNMKYAKIKNGEPMQIKPTLWTHVWHIKSRPHTRGTQSWMIPYITLAGKDEKGIELDYKFSKLPRDNFLYAKAEDLRASILEGAVGYAYDKDNNAVDDVGVGRQAPGSNEDIPTSFSKD